ncbi:MAG: hypothetical protein ACYCPW_05420 [Nitrososphaerales archaeon]
MAKPFLKSGIYKSPDAFVKDLVKDVAASKVKVYEKKIKVYESRYGSFEQFSHRIRGDASPSQEDRWMEWEGARNMLKAWKHVVSYPRL